MAVVKQVRCYKLDLVVLRKRYSIDVDASAEQSEPATIDCEADVKAWEKGSSGDECSSDDEDPSKTSVSALTLSTNINRN